MDRYWEKWDQLEPCLRANGVSLSLGPDASSLVGAWFEETMKFWVTEYNWRATLVQREINHQLEYGGTGAYARTTESRSNILAEDLVNLSPEDWLEVLRGMLNHHYPMATLEELLGIWRAEAFCPPPHPFEHSKEILWLALHGHRASLVVVPEIACVRGGGFRRSGLLDCRQVRTELLAGRNPTLNPPAHVPTYGISRMEQEEPEPGEGQLYNLIPVDEWHRLEDQDFGWSHLALGAQRLGSLMLWLGEIDQPYETVYPGRLG